MEELFKRFCHYYIALEDESVLEELKKETQDEFKDINKKAIKYVKNLRRKASKLGFGVDFESFCECLENYIHIKDGLCDEEKKAYLKVLISLSQIYDVNLREELERYVSYKEVDNDEEKVENDAVDVNEEKNRLLFKKLCLCTLNKDKEGLVQVKEEIINNELDYEEMEGKAISFVKEIRDLTKRLGFGTTSDDFKKMVDKYTLNKKKMTYEQKVIYLKILLYLSGVYDVDLREMLCKKNDDRNREAKDGEESKNILDRVSNPLDNQELLNALLDYRYSNGSFHIEELVLSSDLMIKQNACDDYIGLQSRLVYDLLKMFLEKFKSYSYEELKQEFLELVSEDDVSILEGLTEEIIYNLIQDMKKGEVSRYICKKYKFSDNIYKFMYLCIMEVADLKQEYVGKISMFNLSKKKNTIGIFLYGPEMESLEFICCYIKKCIESGISYDLKGLASETQIVLYANEETLEEKIRIVEEIRKENMELVNSFGVPLHMTARIEESFYGIAGVLKGISYVDYINDLLEVSYYRVIAKLVCTKVSDASDTKIIRDFITLGEISGEDKLASHIQYGELDFGIIKDTINQYVPYVVHTLSIYMEDRERKEELIREFRKSILYVSNVINGKSKREEGNVALGVI